ncbi:MAG: homoserine kinase [Clostridia bacterium]|nr:homoserine kinase [Clostridia bacterium]
MSVFVRVPASSANLGSGVDCMGVALSLYLRVSFREADETRFTFFDETGARFTLPDEENLILAAMRAAGTCVGRPLPPCEVEVNSEIPLSRGLGSSSTAIVAGLLGGFALLGEKPDEGTLLHLGTVLEGHPDNVTPALLGGFTVAASADNGEILRQKLSVPPLTAVVAIPAFRLSTHELRRALPETVPLADAVRQVQRVSLLVAALTNGAFSLLDEATRDVLFTPPRKPFMPYLDDAFAAGRSGGALCCMISGAGPTVLALATEAAAPAVHASLEACFRDKGIEAKVLSLPVDHAGAVLTTEEAL